MTRIQKFKTVLTGAQRKQALILFSMMLLSMILETMGIGLIVPVLVLIGEPDIGSRYPMVQPALDMLNHPSQTQLIIGSMFIMGAFFGFKNAFLAYMAWRKATFIANNQADLSQRLFAGYLRQPYTFHLQRNSAQLIRNVNVESMHFINGLSSTIELFTQGLVLFGISVLLLWVEPIGGIVIFIVLGLASLFLHQMTKVRLSNWGKARQFHEGQRIQHLQQGLSGAKDVKLLGREDDFLAQYAKHNLCNAAIDRKRIFFSSLPKLWFEFLTVIGLISLVLSMLVQGKQLSVLVPTVALFAAAAFRLLPNIGSVMLHTQTLRFVGPVIDNIHAELTSMENVPPIPAVGSVRFQQKLQLSNVSFRYAAVPNLALEKISLEIERGASIGFIGGSGAGKSTLIDVILGLLKPCEGQVLVDGVDIQANMRDWQDQIGYVPQSIYLSDDSLRRNVAFGLAENEIDGQAVDRAIKAAQLEEFIAALSDGLNTVVGERGVRLSGGQRQRIGIARALYHDPEVLVLDEATSALDAETEWGVMQAVSALQGAKTIIIIAHRLSTVAGCDRLYRIENGKIIQPAQP